MENYLMMMYVTLEQEVAIKQLFFSHGWQYSKQDLSKTTEEVGPTCTNVPDTQPNFARKRGNSRKEPSADLLPAKRNNVFASQSIPNYSVQEPSTSSSTMLYVAPNNFTIPVMLPVQSQTIYPTSMLASSFQPASFPSNICTPEISKTDDVKPDKTNSTNPEASDTADFDNVVVKVEAEDPYFSSEQEGCQENQTMNESDRDFSEEINDLNRSQHTHSTCNSTDGNGGGADLSENAKIIQNEVEDLNKPLGPRRFAEVDGDQLSSFYESSQKASNATKKNTRWGLKLFQDWHSSEFGSPLCFDEVQPSVLAEKLAKFYCEARQQDGSSGRLNHKSKDGNSGGLYHKSTLKNLRGAINRHLQGQNIDIVRDKEFVYSNRVFNGLINSMTASRVPKPNEHKQVEPTSDMGKKKRKKKRPVLHLKTQ